MRTLLFVFVFCLCVAFAQAQVFAAVVAEEITTKPGEVVEKVEIVDKAPWFDIRVTEDAPTAPHEIVGEIEVEVDPFAPHPVEDLITILTIGLIHWEKGHFIKKKIMEKLKEKAKFYSADALMNVRYYPDPSKPSFLRNGVYVGKGDLIKYKRSY